MLQGFGFGVSEFRFTQYWTIRVFRGRVFSRMLWKEASYSCQTILDLGFRFRCSW